MTAWRKAQNSRDARLAARSKLAQGKVVNARDATALLEAVIRPGDRVCLEGDNQKQADLLAGALAAVDAHHVHDLHMVQSGIVLPEHLDVFERGIAKRLDSLTPVPNRRASRRCCSAARSSWGRYIPISNCSPGAWIGGLLGSNGINDSCCGSLQEFCERSARL